MHRGNFQKKNSLVFNVSLPPPLQHTQILHNFDIKRAINTVMIWEETGPFLSIVSNNAMVKFGNVSETKISSSE